ncbi:MAG: hypothetical protein ACRDLZ_09965 [Gaiellaceae bacterium]
MPTVAWRIENDHGGQEADQLAAFGLRLGELGPDRSADSDLHPSLPAGSPAASTDSADVEQYRNERGVAVKPT